LLAHEAKNSGQPKQGLRVLLEVVQLNPAWADAIRPQAMEMVGLLTKLPAPELQGWKTELRSAGDIWKLPEPYLALASLEADEKARLDNYKMADTYGSMKARVLVGNAMLVEGARKNQPDLAKEGVAKLREAADHGDAQAMVLLGEALYLGRGVTEDAKEALSLGAKAQELGHEEAFYLVARARLRLAELSNDPAQFAQASALLEKAVAKNLPSSSYFLYIANYNSTVKNPERALAALQKGEAARDPNCLYFLGIWFLAGQAPLPFNETRGRSLMEEAASMGHAKAAEWLKAHPPEK